MLTIVNYTNRIIFSEVEIHLNHLSDELGFKVNYLENDATFNYKNVDWRIHMDQYKTSLLLLQNNNPEIIGVKDGNSFEDVFMNMIERTVKSYDGSIPY